MPLPKWDACARTRTPGKRARRARRPRVRAVLRLDLEFRLRVDVPAVPPIAAGEQPKFSGGTGCRPRPSRSAQGAPAVRSLDQGRRADLDPRRRVRARLGDQGSAAALPEIQGHQDRLGQLERQGILHPPGRADAARPALPEDLFVEMRFGTGSLGAATKEFERRVLSGELDHGGNPILRWMIGHCHVRYDENMNFVPAKNRHLGGDGARRWRSTGRTNLNVHRRCVMASPIPAKACG
jgi:hypothetical protein